MSAGRPGGRWPTPVLACGLLALAGHGLLLGMGGGDSAASPAPRGGRALQATAVMLPPSPVPATEPAPALPAPRDTDAEAAPEPAAIKAAVGSTAAPRFADAPPALDLPDVTLPEQGVTVRVFIEVDAQGRPVVLGTTAQPAGVSAAFAHQVVRALEDARFRADDGQAQSLLHCLQVDFNAGAEPPAWSWRPVPAARAERCLDGRGPAPRPLP